MTYQANLYGTHDESVGTAVLTLYDPAAEVETVRFYVTDASGLRSGRLAADRTSPGVYEKDVLLDTQNESVIEAVLLLKADPQSDVQAGARTFPRTTLLSLSLVQEGRSERAGTLEIGSGLSLTRTADGRLPRLEASYTSAALIELRETEKTSTEVAFGWIRGERVAEVWVYDTLRAATDGEAWPAGESVVTRILKTENEYRAMRPGAGFVRYLQFEPRSELLLAGPVYRIKVEPLPESPPRIEHISQSPGAQLSTTDLIAVVADSANRAGTLRAWLNRSSTDSADPEAAPDGTIPLAAPRSVTSVDIWNLTGGGTGQLFNEISTHAARGKRIFLEYIAVDGTSSGKVSFELLNWLDIIDGGTGNLVTGAIKGAYQFAQGIEPIQVLSTLPANNAGGNTVFRTSDAKLYRWSSAGWTAAVPAADLSGTISAQQIAAQAVTADKLAVNSVVAGTIAAGAINTSALLVDGVVDSRVLAANSVIASKIQAGQVTAEKLTILELSAIKKPDGSSVGLGIIVSGTLCNQANTAGLNLDAGAGQSFLYHPGLTLYGPGSSSSAVFTGTMTLSTESASNRITFLHGGTSSGELATYHDGVTSYLRMSVADSGTSGRVDFYPGETYFERDVFVNGRLKTGDHIEVGAAGWTSWNIRNEGDLVFYEGTTERFRSRGRHEGQHFQS